jgi:hypothetical protein
MELKGSKSRMDSKANMSKQVILTVFILLIYFNAQLFNKFWGHAKIFAAAFSVLEKLGSNYNLPL